MSSSPTQDILDRIDRLHILLLAELPVLSPTIPQLPRITINSVDPSIINNTAIDAYHSRTKSDSMIIDELQQYIQEMERERAILLRSYSNILQLLKYNDIDGQSNLIEHDCSELFHQN